MTLLITKVGCLIHQASTTPSCKRYSRHANRLNSCQIGPLGASTAGSSGVLESSNTICVAVDSKLLVSNSSKRALSPRPSPVHKHCEYAPVHRHEKTQNQILIFNTSFGNFFSCDKLGKVQTEDCQHNATAILC